MRKEGQPSYIKIKWEGFKSKTKEFGREVLDWTDKAAIVVGTGGLLVSAIYPPALIPSLILVGGGVGSMVVTEQILPKRNFKSNDRSPLSAVRV